MRTPTGSRWSSNNYITRCHRRLELVSSISVPVAVGDRMPAEWEPAPDRGLEPSATHGWAAQPRWERSTALVARRTLSQYVAVCLRLQFTSHIQPTSTLSNKVWEVYFYKEVCSFVHWSRLYVSAYICMYMSIQQFSSLFSPTVGRTLGFIHFVRRNVNGLVHGPVDWGCRVYRLQLNRGIRLPQRVSWIWHETIWWWGSSNTEDLGNAEYSFIVIAPRSTLAWSGNTWLGPIYGTTRTSTFKLSANIWIMLN